MRGIVAIIVGCAAGLAFIAGWLLDPGIQTISVTALVCGLAGIFGQMSTRDLVARTTSLIDRGIDEMFSDGGELLAQARVMRDRLERLALTTLIAGVLAPFFATMRSLYAVRFWASAAFAAAVTTVVLAILLFAANRELGRLVEAERIRRTEAKQRRAALLNPPTPPPSSQATDPNLLGYKPASR